MTAVKMNSSYQWEQFQSSLGLLDRLFVRSDKAKYTDCVIA